MRTATSRQLRPRLLRTDPDDGTRPASQIGCDLDEAIAAFRRALPGYGLKLVVPPPLPDGSAVRLCVSAWRRGDGSSRLHAGATAHEAMRLLLNAEAEALRERQRREACALCHGIGWYIAPDGAKAICTHREARDCELVVP